ncbi:HmuY family protein [Pedobacter nutrimenti]|uniref:Heme-binding HmuY-like protein n=1 Tax=Pedobacter nutrimenti TaxID=1241337 RepID=A0A318UDR6_9SPHI|nr:HmuY family protein [Pedobacter nutrimenti]PYF74223.1 heme-binding HmuY-like protein [Pedobacter nutrimenti]
MNNFSKIFTCLCLSAAMLSCKKDNDPIVVVPPPSDGSKLTLNGLIGAEAGSSAGNSVFVDFSADKQTAVARASWDLGFYSGTDFKVILNHSMGATAIALDKNDLTKVTAADTTALALDNTLAIGQGAGGFATIDPVEGGVAAYLAGTVIKTVSATDADNKVYIVNRGAAGTTENRGWQKIRVIRNGNGYTLQYAKINETTFKTLAVNKDAAFNFKYISFVKGAVEVEPAKANWDIQWGLSTYKASATIPYTFSDFVLINFVGGVQAAEVLTSKVSYADFKESDLASATFVADRDAIAGKWRITSGTPLGVKTDRFYVVKDPSGNVYKLKFVSFISNDGGERGKPVIEYKLVKKGS